MVFTNKNRFFTITWEYCRISEKLVNIKNEIIKVKYFRTNWGSQILSNNGCYKVKFITYQTGFNIGPIKNRKQADHSIAFLLNVTWQIFSFDFFLILGGSGL